MEGCHCDKMIFGFWDAQLSPAIRTKLAGLEFNKDTYQNMFKLADQAYLANGGSMRPQPSVVAAIATPSSPSSNEDPQVAAVSRGGGRGGRGGRGNRGGRGRGRGGGASTPQNNSSSATSTTSGNSNSGSKPHQKGPQHPDLPSSAGWACAQHWKKGRGAPYCSDPLVCEWVQIVAPRTTSSN